MKKPQPQTLKALVSIKTGDNKTLWKRIGTAFPLKNRPGFSVRLDLMPAPIDGSFQMILVEPSAEDHKETA